ncbi:hypothetical protein ACFOD1_02600 [Pseudidiomarina halophila]|nr:hypothetical protein [Pseudidiomarina halophila]
MTNMFKKSLVALALAGVSTGAMAADISSSVTTVSNEYLEVNATAASNSISVTLNDEYTENDFLILTFPGENSVDLNNLTTSINVASQTVVVGFDDTSAECTNGTGTTGSETDPADSDTTCTNDYQSKGFTVDYVLSDVDVMGNTYVKYRVTNLGTSGSSTVGATIPFGSVTVNSSAIQGSSSFDVTYFARPNYENYNGSGEATETGVDPLDTADTAALFETGDQFALTVGATVFDETIDVEGNAYRKVFVGSTSDAGEFTLVDNAADFMLNATFESADVSVTGNNMFGWLADGDTDTAGFQYSGTFDTVTVDQVVFTGGATCGTPSHDANELMFSCDAIGQEVVTFNLNQQEVVQNGKFSISAVFNFSDGATTDPVEGSTETDAKAFGEWDINGSVTFIPYMPYSAQSVANEAGLAIDQIIYITNKNASGYGSGPMPGITVRYILEDGTEGTLSNADLGGVKADAGITKITGQVRQALFAAGLLTSSKKVALEVVVEEDPELIEIYSAYNVGGSDRGWVQNDSQRVYHPATNPQ